MDKNIRNISESSVHEFWHVNFLLLRKMTRHDTQPVLARVTQKRYGFGH